MRAERIGTVAGEIDGHPRELPLLRFDLKRNPPSQQSSL
jgi:hypothetical protein